jgi:hypothetical protein
MSFYVFALGMLLLFQRQSVLVFIVVLLNSQKIFCINLIKKTRQQINASELTVKSKKKKLLY